MTTPIDNIQGSWRAYEPADADSVVFSAVGTERRISWGTGLFGQKASVAFVPASPPVQDVLLGDTFVLGTVTFANHDLLPGDTEITALKLHIRIKVDFFLTEFDVILDVGDSDVSLQETIPVVIEDVLFQINITGFRLGPETPTQGFAVEPNQSATYQLVAMLVLSPTEEPHCDEVFEPVFSPIGCAVEAVCPISDTPIISDCFIPDAPLPITDCPEFTIPVSAITSNDGRDGEDGGDGGPGPPGQPGQDGCTPEITVSVSQSIQFQGPCTPSVEVLVEPFGECSVNIHFTFNVCALPPVYDLWACCPFVCCDNSYRSLGGTSECDALTPGGSCSPEGLLIFICECDDATTTTSTTTTPPPEQTSTTSTTPG